MKSRTTRATFLGLLIILALTFNVLIPFPDSSAQGLPGVSTKPAPSVQINWQSKVDHRVASALTAGRTDFMIYMKEQANLSGAKMFKTKNEKGKYVYDQLRAVAQTTQPNVKRTLEQYRAEYQAFWVSNTIAARGDLTLVQAVAMLPEVAAIYPIGKGRLQLPAEVGPSSTNSTGGSSSANLLFADPSPEPGLTRVNADDVWAMGYEGQGAVVAGADTGVRWTHEALKNRYRGWNGATATHDYNWHDGIHTGTWPYVPTNVCNPALPALPGSPSPEPCDDDAVLGGGHGSHTVGSMVGDDGAANRIGMAPQAKWVACRNMSDGVGAIPSYLECMQWFIAPTKIDNSDPDPSKAPDVINNSWGCVEGCPPEPNPLRDSLKASRAAGIVYVASAGNDGDACNTIYHPLARYPEAFTVGSTTHTTDLISDFSSRGPAAADPENPGSPLYLKPNVTAPGSTIRSAQRAADTGPDAYANLSGTSMAGPHVAGLVALVISAKPSLKGNVDRIEEIIQQSAAKKTSAEGCGLDSPTAVPNNTYGFGRIDALAAVLLAQQEVSTQVNYALTTLGAVPSASSTYSERNYTASGAFDGERTGGGWEEGGGWNDGTRDVWPDNLDVTFAGGAKIIKEIRVYTLQNNPQNPVTPDENTDASYYGIENFEVQTYNGTTWVTVSGGSVTGNTKALRVFTLPVPITTTGVRILVTTGRVHYSRIVEVEAFGDSGQ